MICIINIIGRNCKTVSSTVASSHIVAIAIEQSILIARLFMYIPHIDAMIRPGHGHVCTVCKNQIMTYEEPICSCQLDICRCSLLESTRELAGCIILCT